LTNFLLLIEFKSDKHCKSFPSLHSGQVVAL
jgi:hypothetical protein